ncbi:GNAT family N-acetyltransferase [Pseudescherichia sp.]|uniref:GNAT family N-acetyltransferase n=1 Tax=Pseudescherichia sp. TaxID=2055881 RepID=UPI00289801E8|nr:GNAT family N-acetyltransferase [Pseudescherichia sp.]
MVTFRVPTSREFSAFVDYFIPDYAAEIVSNYRLSEVDAVEQARRELEASFPDGEKSAGQVLLCIILSAPEKEHHIGYLWYKPDTQLHSAWINDFYLFPAFRGKGFGSEAMKQLEVRLMEEGCKQIKLRVAAGNLQARRVYENNGFNVTGINMNKVLG